MAISRLLRFFVRGSTEGVLRAIGFFGSFVGVLLLVTGGIIALEQSRGIDVWVLLVVTGLGLMLKPLSKIPFSAILGLFAGLACAGLLYLYFPLPATVLGVSSFWVYLAVFLIPAFIVFLLLKFFEDLAKFFGLILGSWPVLSVLGFLCLAQGVLLLLNLSILSLFS